MQARMPNPALIVPEAMSALLALGKVVRNGGLPPRLIDLVNLRASQVNGCSVCVHMHARDLKNAGETDERLFAVAAWRDSPFFSNAERAVLALTEAVTRLNDTSNAVPDEVWDEAARYYDEAQLGVLVVSIANINLWNRLNIATRQVSGSNEY